MIVDLSATEQMAKELWEAHATLNQELMPAFAMLHWDECDAHDRIHWRALADVALAFKPKDD